MSENNRNNDVANVIIAVIGIIALVIFIAASKISTVIGSDIAPVMTVLLRNGLWLGIYLSEILYFKMFNLINSFFIFLIGSWYCWWEVLDSVAKNTRDKISPEMLPFSENLPWTAYLDSGYLHWGVILGLIILGWFLNERANRSAWR